MISKTLKEIALLVGGTMSGENVTITGLNGIKEAKSGDLTFLADRKYLPSLLETKASAIIISEGIQEFPQMPCVRVPDAVSAFSKIVETFLASDHYVERGIHPTAVIGDEVHIGQNVAIGPHVIIQKGARIGDDTIIHGGCFIGHRAQIGSDCEFHPHVMIRERVQIGHRVIIHSGAVLGADGFGFQQVDGRHVKIPQVGIVRIGDDVEIGANTAIDRARLHETVIGSGTKIDNLVQIGHNATIGKNCLILGQVGISGSAVIEDDVIIAGQAGVVGYVKVGKGAIVASRSQVVRDVEPKTQVMGMPSRPHILMKRIDISLENLPKAFRTINELSRRIKDLEEQIKKLEPKVDS